MRRSALVALLLLSGSFVACGDRDGAGAGSGVVGVVLLGPMCPVESTASPCPDRPMAGQEVRVTRGGVEAGTTRTDDRGRFRIALAPGEYVVGAVLEGAGPPTAAPVPVTVRQGSFTRVTVPVDSGIR